MKADIHVVVNNIPYDIPFANGSFAGGQRKLGYYTTSDAGIQEALESSEFYHRMFVIESVKEVADTVKKEIAQVKATITLTPVTEGQDGSNTFPDVTNGQSAVKAILSLKVVPGMTFATAPKKVADIRKLAKEHNIDFPNWE